MTLPDHPGSSSPASRAGSLARRSPKRLDYVDTQFIGFDNVPAELVDELRRTGVLAGEMWVADAESAVARRRNDGSHYQHVAAWWASESHFVRFDATRELAPTGDGKLRVVAGWSATGKVWTLPQPVFPHRTVWRFELPTSPPTKSGGRRPRSQIALDALPPSVTAPLEGATSGAWMRSRRDWAEELIVACKVADHRVLLLHARREANSRRALETADWVVQTADSPARDPIPFSVSLQPGSSLRPR